MTSSKVPVCLCCSALQLLMAGLPPQGHTWWCSSRKHTCAQGRKLAEGWKTAPVSCGCFTRKVKLLQSLSGDTLYVSRAWLSHMSRLSWRSSWESGKQNCHNRLRTIMLHCLSKLLSRMKPEFCYLGRGSDRLGRQCTVTYPGSGTRPLPLPTDCEILSSPPHDSFSPPPPLLLGISSHPLAAIASSFPAWPVQKTTALSDSVSRFSQT